MEGASSIADRFPLDVIREILKHLASPLDVNRPSAFPWYLGHICSAWRAAFLTMLGVFWSEIHIRWIRRYPNSMAYNNQVHGLVKTFMERNQGRPFSFAWHADSMRLFNRRETSFAQSCPKYLISQSTRWKNAKLHLRLDDKHLLGALKGCLPLLESLTISSSGPGKMTTIP